jgi:hypothetical protein
MAEEGFKRKLTAILSVDVENFKGGNKNEMSKMPNRKYWTKSVLL